jgi:hypothetical protein
MPQLPRPAAALAEVAAVKRQRRVPALPTDGNHHAGRLTALGRQKEIADHDHALAPKIETRSSRIDGWEPDGEQPLSFYPAGSAPR